MTPRELLAKHLTIAAATPSPEEAAAMYADGVTMEFPFAPEGHTRRLEGRDAILAYFGRIKTFSDGFNLGEPNVVARRTASSRAIWEARRSRTRGSPTPKSTSCS